METVKAQSVGKELNSRRRLWHTVLLGALGLCFTPPLEVNAQSESATPRTVIVEGLEERVDAAVLPRLYVGNFNGVVLIAQGEKVLFRKAYGNAVYE